MHRLVAELFLSNPENKPEVHHIDNNTQNNSVDNLQWVTYAEHGKTQAYPKVRKKKPSCVTEATKCIVLTAIKEYEGMELSVADISDFAQLPYSAVRYSIVRLIEEGRLRKNTLYKANSKYARFSYTVLDPAFS